MWVKIQTHQISMKLGTLMFCSLLKKNLKSDFENSKEGILTKNDEERKIFEERKF